MARAAQAIEAGMIYHVLNRGNARMRLFRKDAAFDAFECVLGEWPVHRPRNWIGLVNAALDEGQLDQLCTCVSRGRPCGDEEWTHRTATRLALLFTLQKPGRPPEAANQSVMTPFFATSCTA